MSIKNILISNRQYKTLFQNDINNNLNIQKLWKTSNQSKIFYNATKNPNIILKVRNLNNVDFYNIYSELKAFSIINNSCPNIVKIIKSFVCDQNSNAFEINSTGIISLCKKINNKKSIPLSILALEYVNGNSLNNVIINIDEFKDIIIQLYCVFFYLAMFKMEIIDTNLDNIIYQNNEEILDYKCIFGNKGDIHINHKICIIDLDHLRFNININPVTTDINLYIFNKDNFFYNFFNKLINTKINISYFIKKIKNYLFDGNININKMKPLDIIEKIRLYI